MLNATVQEGGLNWVRGAMNFADDYQRLVREASPSAGVDQFKVGENVAITPARSSFRTTLIELIQSTRN